ncbi:MAG: hypothetical protein GOV02_03605 [Candidatus Aenigmarchaeota archaeon]|nr:hypothetical protein [Candidatus Aenigmarchaeota archaeon]
MERLTKEQYEEFCKFARKITLSHREKLTGRKDQLPITFYVRPATKHDSYKRKIAEKLRDEGKTVYVEKHLTLDGIKMRPDVCYFEDDKWNIIEIEHLGYRKNNIFKNFERLSKIANITVIDI